MTMNRRIWWTHYWENMDHFDIMPITNALDSPHEILLWKTKKEAVAATSMFDDDCTPSVVQVEITIKRRGKKT